MTISEIKKRYSLGFDVHFYSKDNTKRYHYFKEDDEDFYSQDIYNNEDERIETNFFQELIDIIDTFKTR